MVKLLTTGMLAISLSLCTPVFGQAEELNTLIEENYTYKYATSANVNIREEPNRLYYFRKDSAKHRISSSRRCRWLVQDHNRGGLRLHKIRIFVRYRN